MIREEVCEWEALQQDGFHQGLLLSDILNRFQTEI